MLERTQWEREHSVELDRVDTLERHIELHQYCSVLGKLSAAWNATSGLSSSWRRKRQRGWRTASMRLPNCAAIAERPGPSGSTMA